MGEGMMTVTITPVVLPVEQTATLAVSIDDQQWREFWMRRRDALLREVDAIERALSIQPRTAQIRRQYRGECSGY
jgi:hypothetical protein